MKEKLVIIMFIASLSTRAQNLIDTTKYYETANAGSVEKISNKEVCAIVFFISGSESKWNLKDKKRVLTRDEKAFKSMGKEFTNYNVDFKVHFELVNIEEDFKIDSNVDYRKTVVQDHYTRSIVHKESNARKIWTYYSNSENPFFREKKYLSFEGGYFILMYHAGLGISSASPDILNGNDNRTLPEYVTIFAYDPYGRETNKYNTVHETFHLFGAWDLYRNSVYGYSDKDYDMIMEKYPRSIMNLSNQKAIDPITAWRIGINDSPEIWYFEMVPKIYHKEYHMKVESY